MINSEEFFKQLIKEILLISNNQHDNKVKLLLQNTHQEDFIRFSDTLDSVVSIIKDNCLDNNLQNYFNFLITFFLGYYSENIYYFNYKKSIDEKIFSEFSITKHIVNNNLKCFLINIDGYFLVYNDINQKKEQLIKNFLANKFISKDDKHFRDIFLNEKHLSVFETCVDIIFSEIFSIEKKILEFWSCIPQKLQMNYIVSNPDVIKKFDYNIRQNSKQIEEWKQIYSFDLNSFNSSKGLFFPTYCIDTSLFPSEVQKSLEKHFECRNIIDFNILDGLLLHSENFKGLLYLKSHLTNKIDCIYIDPPYNTGSSDFLYSDDYSKKHWFWLLENRLTLAYELLNEDGVLFMSIDDNELITVRTLLDSIFDRFVGMYVWHKKTQPSFLNKELISVTEYIVVYKKGTNTIKMKGGFTDPNKHTELLNISNEVSERFLPKTNTIIYNNGKLYTGTIGEGLYGNNKLQVTLKRAINVIKGIADNDINLLGRFRWTQEKMDNIYTENRKIVIKSLKTLRPTVSGSGKAKIRPPITLLSKKINDIPTNTDGNFEMKDLFTIPPFYYPKPVNLIKYLLDSVTYNKKDAIVLDFFAGSGTTGQAVIGLNREDYGKRKFILIEQADYFDNILVPRIKKCLYSDSWEKGRPMRESSIKALIKTIIL